MNSTEREIIARHRMARGHRLEAAVDTVTAKAGADVDQAADLARSLTTQDWGTKVGVIADANETDPRWVPFEQRPPSQRTAEIATRLLEVRAENADKDPFAGFPTF